MTARSAVTGLLALVALPIASAAAVDVVNEDRNSYRVIIQDDRGQREMEIQAGQSLRGICGACSITIETDDPLEAQGAEVVQIKAGKLQIKG